LTALLRIEHSEFMGRYCRWVESGEEERLSLKEKPNFDCIFWDNKCAVYQSRPLQCRNYPFWQAIVCSARAWASAGQDCPGINSGNLHGRDEIEELLAQRDAEEILVRETVGGTV